MKSKPEPEPVSDFPDDDLRFSIAPANSGHDLAAFVRLEDVSHQNPLVEAIAIPVNALRRYNRDAKKANHRDV